MSIAERLAALSRWIDEHPDNAARDREAALWGRIAKVSEEAGEAIAALVGATGQNPGKGTTHDLCDVRKELLDVAVTALAAVEHLEGNKATCLDLLVTHVVEVAQRAGVAVPAECPHGSWHTVKWTPGGGVNAPGWECTICDEYVPVPKRAGEGARRG
jgi:NTP pyrophosphatase (non-canonical NTP hydrolase)